MNASASAPAVIVRALIRPGTPAQLASRGLTATALAAVQALVLAGVPSRSAPWRASRAERPAGPRRGATARAGGPKSLILNG